MPRADETYRRSRIAHLFQIFSDYHRVFVNGRLSVFHERRAEREYVPCAANERRRVADVFIGKAETAVEVDDERFVPR